MPRQRSLKGYEGANLLFFLGVVVVLGTFVWFVFHFYRNANRAPVRASIEGGVLSNAVIPGADSCIFYVGTRLSTTKLRYVNGQIPVTDDGLVKDLFGIPGVLEVVIDQSLVMLHKTPGSHWEAIQPLAREIINRHLHIHH
jgi:hypothetical protein